MNKYLTILLLITTTLTTNCPNDERCASCVQNKCVVCYDSYLNQNGLCTASSKKIAHCLQYESEGTCKFCYHGFYLSKNSICEKIPIKNCLELNKDGNCQVCKRGVLLKNGLCDDKNKCQTPNCDVCSLNASKEENCVSCKNGFAISFGYGCQLEQENSHHCLFLNQNGECVICDYNFYHKNGQCVKSSVVDIKMDLDGGEGSDGEIDQKDDEGFFDGFMNKVKDFFGMGIGGFEISLALVSLMMF